MAPRRAPKPGSPRTVLLAILLLVALAGAERGVRLVVSHHLLPTRGAQWIWADGSLETTAAIAFFAARDFELANAPAGGSIHVLADEEYILYLNGHRLGSRAYVSGAPLDGYPVSDLLETGWNRLVVELRSERGAGGLLLALFSPGHRDPLLVSDRHWKVFRTFHPGLVEGWSSIDDGESPVVWQDPPTGSWGLPSFDPERPSFNDLRRGMTRQAAIASLPADTPGRRSSEASRPGDGLVFDFGEPVHGYLVLRGLAGVPRRLGLTFAMDPRLAMKGLLQESRALLAKRQEHWSDSEARTFRYVRIETHHTGIQASVILLEPSFVAQEEARRKGQEGVFGLQPPARMSLTAGGLLESAPVADEELDRR